MSVPTVSLFLRFDQRSKSCVDPLPLHGEDGGDLRSGSGNKRWFQIDIYAKILIVARPEYMWLDVN